MRPHVSMQACSLMHSAALGTTLSLPAQRRARRGQATHTAICKCLASAGCSNAAGWFSSLSLGLGSVLLSRLSTAMKGASCLACISRTETELHQNAKKAELIRFSSRVQQQSESRCTLTGSTSVEGQEGGHKKSELRLGHQRVHPASCSWAASHLMGLALNTCRDTESFLEDKRVSAQGRCMRTNCTNRY